MTPDFEFAEGFYAQETDGRWMQLRGTVRFAAADVTRYFECLILSEFMGFRQEITGVSGAERSAIALRHGWSPWSFVIPPGATELALSVNVMYPREYYHPGDNRELAVRLKDVVMHDSERRHRNVTGQQSNFVANSLEMYAGATSLRTTPPRLGIDLHGACNVKPPCVYCEWDGSKALEGDDVDTPFTLETLADWGPFFDNSSTLINCSIGEPFLMRNLDQLLDAFGDANKVLELTTNGQIMTDRIIQRLVGRPIRLHVSLDAGTPETYAKLRNNRFEPILKNLERLVAAKGGRGRFPTIHLVFMPMRVNVHELPLFIDVAARLQVELAVLRPLNYAFESNLNWDRAGYRFEYVKELLPLEELARVSGRAAELAARAGVNLADQMDFGGLMRDEFRELYEEGRRSVASAADPAREQDAAHTPAPAPASAHAPAPEPAPEPVAAASPEPALDVPIETRTAAELAAPLPSLGDAPIPACTEPWDSLYILRRGVLPCCYGAAPIAKMSEYREAWNSPLLQDIRRELAAGRFHQYCRESPSCPIVRKLYHDEKPLPPPAPPESQVPRSLFMRVRGRAARTLRRLAGR